MADQPYRAHRGQDAYGHRDQRSSGGTDPLAELARLIGGQNDPFAQPRGVPRDGGDWRTNAGSYPHDANGHYPQHRQADAYYDEQSDPRYGTPFATEHGYNADPYYRDDAPDDMYEQETPARRRGGMLTVMAVLALALLGTAAAFGYRAVFGNNSPSPPPVIKADTTPNKIVPATTPGEQSKQIYDRVGDKSQPERLVPREEKPVDVGDNLKPAPRVITATAATGTTPSNPMAAPSAPQLPANTSALVAPGAPPSTAPKRVRTVTIKPDGPDAEAPVAPRTAAKPTAAQASAASAETVSPPPAPIPTRTVSTRAPATQAHNPNAPLSLSPAANAAPALAPARTPTMRTASAPVAAPAPAGAGGGYTVQISSQRSEADAQASFRSLQGKYPDVLGSYQPMIRRADLGTRGVYYRVQVGPFASDQATDLCSRLQSAGGQCVVQRN